MNKKTVELSMNWSQVAQRWWSGPNNRLSNMVQFNNQESPLNVLNGNFCIQIWKNGHLKQESFLH